MGREIRRVPADWDHPRKQCEHSPWKGGCEEALQNNGRCYQPLFDRSFRQAAEEWKRDFAAWERGERPDYCSEESKSMEAWEYNGGPPDRNWYRPDWPEESMTHYQVYETVSEGTPVTPHFATQEELVDYLVKYGDRWDQIRGDGGWSQDNAVSFVYGTQWAPSLIIADGKMFSPRDGNPLKGTDGR